jgi:hypothetical protein
MKTKGAASGSRRPEKKTPVNTKHISHATWSARLYERQKGLTKRNACETRRLGRSLPRTPRLAIETPKNQSIERSRERAASAAGAYVVDAFRSLGGLAKLCRSCRPHRWCRKDSKFQCAGPMVSVERARSCRSCADRADLRRDDRHRSRKNAVTGGFSRCTPFWLRFWLWAEGVRRALPAAKLCPAMVTNAMLAPRAMVMGDS